MYQNERAGRNTTNKKLPGTKCAKTTTAVVCECSTKIVKRTSPQPHCQDKLYNKMITSPGDQRADGDGPTASKKCSCGLEGFGVKVDLSSFFTDERSCCWTWVEARKPVQWLETRLQSRLRLTRVASCIALLAPAGLLHPDDPLALLSPGDVVRVVPFESTLFSDGCCYSPVWADKPEGQHGCTQTHSNDEIYICHSESDRNEGIRFNIKDVKENPKCNDRAVTACPETRGAGCMAEEPLQAVKRRALELLNRYEESIDSVSSPPTPPPPPRASSPRSPPRPDHTGDVVDAGPAEGGGELGGGRGGGTRRRRVRRRPRRPPSPDIATSDTLQVVAMPASASRASSVVRNRSPRPHSPRRVHALAV